MRMWSLSRAASVRVTILRKRSAVASGYVYIGVGLISAAAAIAGHYLGAGLAIKNGSRIVRPTVIVVLLLLAVKVGSELLFPEFWN